MFATYYNPGAAATGDASHVGLNGQNRVAEITGGVLPNTLNVGTVNGIPTGVAYNPYLSTPYNVAATGQPVGYPTVAPIPGVTTPVTGWNTIPTTLFVPPIYNTIPTTPFGWTSPISAINPMCGVSPFSMSPWSVSHPSTMFGLPTTSFGMPFNPVTGINSYVNPMLAAGALASTFNPITSIPSILNHSLVNPMNIASINPFVNPISRINTLAGGIVNPFVGVNPITGLGSTIPATFGIPGAIPALNPFSSMTPWNTTTLNPFSTIGANPFIGGAPLGLNPFICAGVGINPFCGTNPISSLINNPLAINPWSTTPWASSALLNSIANPFVNPLVSGLNGTLANPMMNPFINSTAGLNPWTTGALSAAACGCSPIAALGYTASLLNPWSTGSIPTTVGFNSIATSPIGGIVPTTVNPFACSPIGCF